MAGGSTWTCCPCSRYQVLRLLTVGIFLALEGWSLLAASRLPRNVDDSDAVAVRTLQYIGGRSQSTKTTTDASIQSKVGDVVFQPWPGNRTLPCFHPTDHEDSYHWTDKRNLKRPAVQGLFFVKLLKTASTTSTSVHLRIARNLALRTNQSFEICKTRHLHGWAGPRLYHYDRRQRDASFLWTMVREPSSRYVSEYFHFGLSRHKQTDAVHYLKNGPHSDHHYLSWLSTRKPQYHRRNQGGRPYLVANRIINDYDFMGVTERFAESVVVLQMLLNLPMADILHISSKVSGGYDDGEYRNECTKIQRSTNVTSELKEYLQSDEWLA
jgi:hypothetical protein